MATPAPPVVPPKPHEVVTPDGSKRNDPYAWLRDDKNPEVIEYLKAENKYGADILKPNGEFEKRILSDMDSRVPRHESTPATPADSLSYWYGSTRGPGQDYWVYIRQPGLTKLQGHTQGPLSYGPDLKASEQVVLDINKLAKGLKYCDVASVKPSPDGRYVAFTVDTVGNEEYELVVQEIGTGRRVPFAGGGREASARGTRSLGGMRNVGPAVEWAPDSAAVFALQLTTSTHEAYKLVRCRLMPGASTATATAARAEPELLLQDDQEGAVLEMAGATSCGRFLMLSRKAEGYTALLALPLPPAAVRNPSAAIGAAAGAATVPAKQPSRGVPAGVKLYGNDPWVVVAPESDACDVLRADHLYGDGYGKETFAVLLDSDKYPDGCVCAVTGGDLKRRTVLVPGQRGRQIVDIAVRGGCDGGVGAGAANGTANGASHANGAATAANGAAGKAGRYLVVHMLEDMKATVQVYDISSVKQTVAARIEDRAKRGRQRRRAQRAAAAPPPPADKKGGDAADDDDDDGDDDGDADDDDDDDDEETTDEDEAQAAHQQQQQQQLQPEGVHAWAVVEAAAATAAAAAAARSGKAQAAAPAPAGQRLPCLWTYSPGDAISSLHLDHGCWHGTLPYVRLSYSNLTTPTTTVDLDLTAQKADVREVERVENFAEGRYMSTTMWATSHDGTRVPATLACRADAWPPATGRPLPCILQAYGAYGRKLLPDFIPGDLAMLDGGGDGPCLVVLAHVRGGGELGSYWHVEGKKHKKINTQADISAVVRELVEGGWARRDAVALWGRSAGGLAMGMALERCPPGTFRTAVLDVPFLDVLGAMTDPSLPLTIKERPEWGDPATSQEDYDYILSYSPYDNVEPLATQTPAIIVTCSLHDPRVPYWGPAKFVARLRAAMAAAAAAAAGGGGGGAAAAAAGGGGPVLLLTELEAGGHFAASGASGRLAERAMRVAFILRQLGVAAAALQPAAKPGQPATRPGLAAPVPPVVAAAGAAAVEGDGDGDDGR